MGRARRPGGPLWSPVAQFLLSSIAPDAVAAAAAAVADEDEEEAETYEEAPAEIDEWKTPDYDKDPDDADLPLD